MHVRFSIDIKVILIKTQIINFMQYKLYKNPEIILKYRRINPYVISHINIFM